MRYFLNKSKEEILLDISARVNSKLTNTGCALGSDGQMGSVISILLYGIEDAIREGFEALLDNSVPESELDDILLGEEDT